MNVVIEGKQISKVYGSGYSVIPALQHIDLTVMEGESVAVMGPSGSGKTTLLNILATIDSPTSGEVVIDGHNILNMNEEQLSSFRRDRLGFVFQDYNLLDTLTVKENIVLPLAIAKMNVGQLEQRASEVAVRFGIQSILDKYPYQISGGQKQRTAASRAIVTKPALLLADEPTGALDSKSATDFLESLKELNEQEGTTVLMVTHDAYAASYCNRVIFIKDGSLFTELVKGSQSRREMFKKVLDVLAVLGGGAIDAV
ncbi:ABC transporter ATP-binding protein [Paenibacillus sp. AR247]|uniref:ABC transporter ATP-binding protein n=1 Tax=Paenibacillus sp. AR247 TaxID=1631599 RepID=UPI000CF93680|nr:ABC transporter ATP-binding protein [Paenibacillus sp. AR247]PQP89194.1 bacitracin ABC transporter ATP-binding protein [Paenibacillus sp. AR247]